MTIAKRHDDRQYTTYTAWAIVFAENSFTVRLSQSEWSMKICNLGKIPKYKLALERSYFHDQKISSPKLLKTFLIKMMSAVEHSQS